MLNVMSVQMMGVDTVAELVETVAERDRLRDRLAVLSEQVDALNNDIAVTLIERDRLREDNQTLNEIIETQGKEINALRERCAEQAAWIDSAVAKCGTRQCAKRDQQLRELREELAAAQRVPLTADERMHAIHMVEGHQTYHREYIVAAALLRAHGIDAAIAKDAAS